MNEMKRAEQYASDIIRDFNRERSPLYKQFTYNYDLACEDGEFQELVIQQIRNQGYLVGRNYDEDGLNILLRCGEEVKMNV